MATTATTATSEWRRSRRSCAVTGTLAGAAACIAGAAAGTPCIERADSASRIALDASEIDRRPGEPPFETFENEGTPPILMSGIRVQLPRKALFGVAEGSVEAVAPVRRDGSVEIVPESPEGFGLGTALRDTVGRWEYRPARRRGIAVDSLQRLDFEFEVGTGLVLIRAS